MVITVLFIISFISSLLLTKLMIRLSYLFGLLGRDIHKPNHPLVPRVGGLAIVITYLIVAGATILITRSGHVATFLIAPAIAAVIGLIEDVRGELNPLLKPLLLLLPGLPVVLLGAYDPRPVLPFIGQIRITLLYPLLVFAAYTVVSNAVNSLDVVNGSLVLTSIPPLLTLAVISMITGKIDSVLFVAIVIAAMLGFLRYNWYPAKVFSGNAGSNLIGALIASIAISSKLEVVAIIALFPHVMNEFYVLVSMRGVKSGKQVKDRPVTLSGNLVSSTMSPHAPLTLVRMLTADRPRSEAKISLYLSAICTYSSLLAVLTYIIDGVL